MTYRASPFGDWCRGLHHGERRVAGRVGAVIMGAGLLRHSRWQLPPREFASRQPLWGIVLRRGRCDSSRLHPRSVARRSQKPTSRGGRASPRRRLGTGPAETGGGNQATGEGHCAGPSVWKNCPGYRHTLICIFVSYPHIISRHIIHAFMQYMKR